MRALLSVANREGISTFARELQRLGVELFATDGTRDHLAADGIEVASVSDLTAVPPLVGGQVRTFHPAIYAGILARRDVPAQLEELKAHGLELLDLVVVNVKSFAPEVGRGHIGIDEAIEMIDVAGAALLGAAARNAAGVVAVSDPGHYGLDPRRDADPRAGLRRHALSPGGRRVLDGRRLLRRDRGLPQPDRRQRLPEAAGDGAGEGLGPAVRREPPPAGGLLPRDDAPLGDARRRDPDPRGPAHVQQPARPRRRVPDRRRLHGADRRPDQAHRPGRRRLGGGAGRGLQAGARHRPGRLVRRDRRGQPRARRRHGAGDRRQLLRGGHRARLLAGRPRHPRGQARASSCCPSPPRPPRACATTASRTSTSSASAAACWSRRSTPSTSTAASSRSSPGATRRWAS